MRQLLTVLLTFSLIFSSISPSYAQIIRSLSKGGKVVQGQTAVANNAERIANLSKSYNVANRTFYYVNPHHITTTDPFLGGQSVFKQLGNTAQFQALAKKYPHIQLQSFQNSSIEAAGQDMGDRISRSVDLAVATQNYRLTLLLEDLTASQWASLSRAQLQEIVPSLIERPLPATLQRKYFLDIIPQLVISRGLALTASQYDTLLQFYRNTLKNTSYENAITAPISKEGKDLTAWAQAMTAVSNLGLFGSLEDASLILATAKKSPIQLQDYTDLITGRALLAMGADGALRELAAFSARTYGKLSTPFWKQVSDWFEQTGSPLEISIEVSKTESRLPIAEEALLQKSNSNLLHFDGKTDATLDWISQRYAVLPPIPVAHGTAEGTAAIRETLTAPELSLDMAHTPGDLALARLQISGEGAQPGVTTTTSSSSGATQPVAATPVPASVSASAQRTEQPSLFRRYFSKWVPGFLNRTAQKANQSAKFVLTKPSPLVTQLRDIVFSEANASFKKQALIRLYDANVFDEFLQQQPEKVRNAVLNAPTKQLQAEALWRLYQAHYLDPTLEAIADVLEQGSLVSELQGIVTQADWRAKAARAYEAEEVLPFTGEDHFSGEVPTVPVADQQEIVATFRPEGFAFANKTKHVDTAQGSYYSNNVPFYYRNSKGELSSKPVGILSQVPANWYGRLLSSLHLATQPGMTIPKGFVLALDEQGQWKFFMPKGNLAIVESDPVSKKVLEKIQTEGSYRVAVDSPYSTTDLLAMAHMLEHNPTLNLELTLNTPHSLKPFLMGHAFFVGNDAGASLTGPFKDTLKTVEGFVNMLGNFVSGFGYVSPIAGGYAMPTMSRWGNVKTTKRIYALSGAALAFSLFGLGMNGFSDPSQISLWGLAIPTVALVLGASLANSFVPTFLNFYKDPTARTAANLDFATNKQLSRLMLTGLTAVGVSIGMNWTAVVPIGLGLLGVSYALFRNTPMFREAKAAKLLAKQKAEQAAAAFAALSPEEQAAKQAKEQEDARQALVDQAQFVAEYRQFKNNLREMRDIRSRVKMVYASYAASLMMLGQGANAVLGPGFGQALVTTCMVFTFLTRKISTKLVKANRVTDDQLTGISLPMLALTGTILALAPYHGPIAIGTAAAAILHYMATAVPGQLDAARMQNIVTAEMRARKQKIEQNPDLTPAEKDAQIQRLSAEEKVWSAQASKDYSLYNARGLWGVGATVLGGGLFIDLGPQWTQDVLEWISQVFDASQPSIALNRLLLGYSSVVASVLAWKNKHLLSDFFNLFGKREVTEAAIANNEVTAKTFGINHKNASLRLVDSQKQIKDLGTQLVDYGKMSEQKMTTLLNKLTTVYNRLVAEAEILGITDVNPVLDELRQVVQSYEVILQHNDLSIMLQRQFAKLKNHLYEGEGKPVASPEYMEEGSYELPVEFDAYESASWLVSELDQLAYTLTHGSTINASAFVNYLNRAKEDLLRYEKANPADAPRVAAMNRKIDDICKALEKDADTLLAPKGNETKAEAKALQDLRDVLAAYAN